VTLPASSLKNCRRRFATISFPILEVLRQEVRARIREARRGRHGVFPELAWGMIFSFLVNATSAYSLTFML